MNVTACDSCGAAIIWVVTVNGKRMPIDAKPLRKVLTVIDGDPPTAVFKDEYVSHFATCRDAASWRRSKHKEDTQHDGK